MKSKPKNKGQAKPAPYTEHAIARHVDSMDNTQRLKFAALLQGLATKITDFVKAEEAPIPDSRQDDPIWFTVNSKGLWIFPDLEPEADNAFPEALKKDAQICFGKPQINFYHKGGRDKHVAAQMQMKK